MASFSRRTAFLLAFGAHVRALRMELSLSQEELTVRAGLHVTYLDAIEQGKKKEVTLRNAKSIADALRIPARDLFTFEE